MAQVTPTLIGTQAPELTLDGVLNKQFGSFKTPVPGKWTLLVFYPLDFTFVCPTELIAYSDAVAKFKELGVELFGISVDSKFSHLAWTETDRKVGGVGNLQFPLLADLNKTAAAAYGVLNAGGVALRGNFLIDPSGIIQHATINNTAVGRSVDETLRTIQAFQYTATHGEVCPADWTPGADAMKPNPTGLKEYASKHG